MRRLGLYPGLGLSTDGGVRLGDGPSGTIQVPLSAAAFLAVTGRNASHSFGCQEASGNLADSIGALTLTANATPLYQQTVAGWDRKGVGFNETLSQRFTTATGTGPNPTLTAVAMLVYATIRTVAAIRCIVAIGDGGAGARCAVHELTAGTFRTICGSTNNDGAVDHRDSAVHPIMLTYDLVGTSINRYTDLEKDNGTFAAGVIDAPKGIGGVASQTSHLGEILAYWILAGADAQFTDADAKTFLQSLGWSIPW